ncbi:bifunctional DNA primase/polymerase [Candidatus Gracilibacteria bacterium]|nr:bifunctional DNA primase/polymerase [Candidatus Gracilibacteria bacterium]
MNNIPDELPEIFSEETFSALTQYEKALYYSQQLHLGIIPIKHGDKSPEVDSWKPYRTQKPSLQELEKWFNGSGKKNFGIIIEETYGIIALDIDSYHADYDGSFFQGREIPVTWTVLTGGGGRHIYFKFPQGRKLSNKPRLASHIEFKASGHYLVAPGSTHKSGGEYKWAPGLAPWDVELAEAPSWLVEMVAFPDKKTLEVSARNNFEVKDWAKIMGEIHHEGERDTTLFAITGKLIHDEKDPEKWISEVLPKLLKYNQTNCIPPYPEEKIVDMVRRIGEYETTSRLAKNTTELEADLLDSKNGGKVIDRVYHLIEEKIKLIIDQNGVIYLIDMNDSKKKLYPMGSDDLTDYILREYQKEFGGILGQDTAKNVAANIRALAKNTAEQRNVYTRIGYDKATNTIYYDLNNEAGEIVKIWEENMEIVVQNDTYFKRFSKMDKQVMPEKGGDFECIWKYFNIETPEDKHLFLVYLIALFLPHIELPILVFNGDKGSAKTSGFRFVRELIDPLRNKKFAGYRMPSKADDLQIQLTQGYFHTYDNLSEIKAEVSDTLCEVVTGGGFSTRKKYSDEEMMERAYSVRLGIGSINTVTYRDDLIERSIVLNLNRIEGAQDFPSLLESFEEEKAKILDCIFCTIALVLGDTEVISGLPRMAEFASWGEKISRILGYPDGEFIRIYKRKLEDQNQCIKKELVPTYILQAIDHILASADTWRDTPARLFDICKTELKLPLTPNELGSFCRALYAHENNLRALGICISHQHSGNRTITISRIHQTTDKNLDTSDTLDGISDETQRKNTE